MLWVLTALLLAAPTVTLPDTGPWLAVKAFAMETAGVLLAVFICSRGDWTRERVRAALLSAPNIAVLLFLLWVGLSAARSELPEFSRFEAMRHLGGGLIYFAALYGISARRHLGRVVMVLAVAGSLGAIMAFIHSGESDSGRIAGAFRNVQLLSGFLCLIAPVVLMASQTEEDPTRRLVSQVALIVILAGILIGQNRSVWIGAAVSLLVMGLLYLRYGRVERDVGLKRDQVLVPLVVVALAAGLFFAVSRAGGSVARRAGTLAAVAGDQSVQWRLGMWSKAIRMTRDYPVFGWGVGTFPVNQALYYHPDAPGRSQRSIARTGATLDENAHNTYLQLMAELGLPGLALYLGIFVAYFVTAVRALSQHRSGFRQSMLIAVTAAVAGQMVSAVGSPAWEFAECSLFLWLMLGLGLAAAGVAERGRGPSSGRRVAARETVKESPVPTENIVIGG